MSTHVYVIAMSGHPLMPCSPRKARKLLDDKAAIVKKRTPFTIQLTTPTSEIVQEVVLGVDAGSKTIGLSAAAKDEELYAAEVLPRNDVVENLSARRAFRRARRNRKTRYRKPRFNNRVGSKNKGWLAPSVEVKIQEHITAIKRVCAILPISKVVVETAEFDLQLLKAIELGLPVPEGEDYQKGEMLGTYNVRQYALKRDNYQCCCCGAKSSKKQQVKFHVHHAESRKTGGDASNNLYTLCESCHEKLHKGLLPEEMIAKLKSRKLKPTRDATFMGIMRKTLLQRLRSELDIPVWETHGYVTKYTRAELLKLPKSHINDALCIAAGRSGFGAVALLKSISRTDRQYAIRPVRHHNRQLHKATILKGGVRKSNQASVYVKGFRLYDKVLYNGVECFIWGRRETGYFLLRKLNGTKVKDGVSYKQLSLLERSSNYIQEGGNGNSSPTYRGGGLQE